MSCCANGDSSKLSRMLKIASFSSFKACCADWRQAGSANTYKVASRSTLSLVSSCLASEKLYTGLYWSRNIFTKRLDDAVTKQRKQLVRQGSPPIKNRDAIPQQLASRHNFMYQSWVGMNTNVSRDGVPLTSLSTAACYFYFSVCGDKTLWSAAIGVDVATGCCDWDSETSWRS